MVGQMKGALKDIEPESDTEPEEMEEQTSKKKTTVYVHSYSP